MNVSTNDLKNGMALDLPEGLFTVVEFQHVKPGKGGAFVRTKLKNVRTGAVIERTYRADEKLEQAIIDKREMQYLYRESAHYVFMDNVSYDQLNVDAETLGGLGCVQTKLTGISCKSLIPRIRVSDSSNRQLDANTTALEVINHCLSHSIRYTL